MWQNISFIEDNHLSSEAFLIINSTQKPFEMLLHCFIYQQTGFDLIKEENSDDVEKLQNFVISHYKNVNTLYPTQAQNYTSLATQIPPTDDGLYDPAVQICIQKHFPDWSIYPRQALM